MDLNTHVILASNVKPEDLIPHTIGEHKFEKTKSEIVDSVVYRLTLPETFRFATFIELIPMQDGSIELIFTRPKSSRWHDYFYDEIIKELSFKSKNVANIIENYVSDLKKKGLVLIVKDKHDVVEEHILNDSAKKVTLSLGNQYELIILLLNSALNKNKITDAEQKILNQQIIPISDNMVVDHILNKRGMTSDEIDSLMATYKTSKKIEPTFQIDIDNESVLSDLLIELKKSEIFKEERQVIRKELIQAGETTVDYAVFDKINNLTFPASFGEHYYVLTSIIAKYHYDEFMRLSQKEKDQFILDNFLIIGSYYPDNSPGYEPDIMDIDYKKRHKIDIQPVL